MLRISVSMAELSPYEQLVLDIADLEAQRELLYGQFREIEASLTEKNKLLESFQLVKDSPELQQALIVELIKLGIIDAADELAQ